MVPGFNTDFKYRGQTFHVQTEDNGVANPVVVSLLYHKGAILASRRSSYRELLEKPDCTEQLKELMKSQHKALMRELLAGAYDAKLPGAAAAAAAMGPAASQSAASPPAPEPSAPRHTPAADRPVPAGPTSLETATSAPTAERPGARHELPRRSQAPAVRTAPAAGRRPPASLDEAIMRYLEEHAAAAAAAR